MRQIIHSLYQAKEVTQKVYNSMMINNVLYRCTYNCFKKAIQKTAKATGDLIGNKNADRITKVLKTSQKKIIQKQMKKKYLEND